MEDKRLCSHCGGELHRKPYLMSQRATERVLSTEIILWVIIGAFVLVAQSLHA